MVFTHEAALPLPLSAIHLDAWLFNACDFISAYCRMGDDRIQRLGDGVEAALHDRRSQSAVGSVHRILQRE